MAQVLMPDPTALSNSDDDLFIPIYIPGSSDDESAAPARQVIEEIDDKKETDTESKEGSGKEDEISIDERPDSSEELSSQSSSQENHGIDGDCNQDTVAANPVRSKRSKKKSKKAKASEKGKKSGKNKPANAKKAKDNDMAFLEQYLRENKPAEWKTNPTAVVGESTAEKSTSGKPTLQELKQKLRDKKIARHSPLDKALDRFNSAKPSIREQLKRGIEKKQIAANLSSSGFVKTAKSGNGLIGAPDLLDLHRQVSAACKSKGSASSRLGGDRIEMLIRKYEEFVADGRMTLDEAIELAWMGKDITEPTTFDDGDAELFTSEEDKRKQMEYYYKAIARMDPQNGGRMQSNIPQVIQTISREFAEHSIECEGYVDMMRTISRVEQSINEGVDPDSSLNQSAWESMCNIMYEKFSDKMKFNTTPAITDPIKFYQEALKSWIIQLMNRDLERLDQSGVFARYDPLTQPLILACFQKHVADLFPTMQLVLDMKKVVEAGFAPQDAFTYNPHSPGHTLLAFGLFWSFSCSFNLFVAFYRAPTGGYTYYWVPFDRLNHNINDILKVPRKTYRESVSETVDDEQAILNCKRELISVEMGSTADLEHCITINSDEVLNPSFIQGVASETKELMQEVDQHPEKSINDIADAEVTAGFDGKSSVKVEFRDDATAEEKGRALLIASGLASRD